MSYAPPVPPSGLFYHDALGALAAAGVPFVVVGGVAVNLQGVPRFTADLDVAVAVDGPTLLAAARALETLGLRCRLPVSIDQLADEQLVREWIQDRNLQAITFVDPVQPLREVDLLVVSTVPYPELERSADVLTAAGLVLRVASIEHLIRMKEGTGRAQDASDVDALRRISRSER